ncbi:hypothetical protein EDD15DRAFT_2174739, partial [Pisolithus albus]
MHFHPDVLEALPIWFHVGALPSLKKLNNFFYSHCLCDHHHISSTKGITNIACTRLCTTHTNQGSCDCATCSKLRKSAGCLKPFKCINTAKKILDCLPPKWVPAPLPHRSNPDLTAEGAAQNQLALKNDAPVTFNPMLTENGPIENAFHIICPSTTWEELP